MELAQGGDKEAFALLYDVYVDTVFRYVLVRVANRALAEDLTSETFLRAMRRIDSFTWQGKDIAAWFVTIARNLIADHVKSAKFRFEVATADMRDADERVDSPDTEVLTRLRDERLVSAIRDLGSDQAECITLRFLQGLSLADTAKVLGKSEGAVKQLQLRATRALRKSAGRGRAVTCVTRPAPRRSHGVGAARVARPDARGADRRDRGTRGRRRRGGSDDGAPPLQHDPHDPPLAVCRCRMPCRDAPARAAASGGETIPALTGTMRQQHPRLTTTKPGTTTAARHAREARDEGGDMDLGPTADGELLQRALDGEPVSEPGILELVAVLHAVQSVEQAGLAPRAEFVSDLRARLLADDAAAGPRPWSRPFPSTGGTPGTGGTVSVLRVAAKPLKMVAAAAASILVIGGALGFASRSAVPGDTLYGVKQLLDRVAVQLAGSRYDQGLTYLAQAQEHIAEARDLIDGGNPSTHDLDAAYDAATDATSRAQTILTEVYRTEQRTEALTELSDFYARAIPQVDAMRPRVPAGSLPAWQRLRDLLGAGDVATLRGLAACGSCGDRATSARQTLTGSDRNGPARQSGQRHVRPGRPAVPGRWRHPLATRTVGSAPARRVCAGRHRSAAARRRTVNLPGVGVASSTVACRRWRGHPARRDGEPSARRCHVLDHRDRRGRGHPAWGDDPAAVGHARRPPAADQGPAHHDPADPGPALTRGTRLRPVPPAPRQRTSQRKTDLRCISRL